MCVDVVVNFGKNRALVKASQKLLEVAPQPLLALSSGIILILLREKLGAPPTTFPFLDPHHFSRDLRHPILPHNSAKPSENGSLRRYKDRLGQVSPLARLLPPSLLQKHPRNRTGNKRMEVGPRDTIPRERKGAQGSCSLQKICW